MGRITSISAAFGRTIIPPGGDRYQPVRFDAAVTRAIDPDDDIAKERVQLQRDLRSMLEETYLTQMKGREIARPPADPPPAEPPTAPEPPQTGSPTFTPAVPPDEPMEF